MTNTHTPVAEECLAWIPAHGGPVAQWEGSSLYATDVAGDGLEGWQHDKPREGTPPHSRLQKHVQTPDGYLMLEIRPSRSTIPGESPIWWSATLMVGKGRYVRQSGGAHTVPEALAAVAALRHESRPIGGLTWWRQNENHWLSWLGPYSLEAHRYSTPLDNEHPWHFQITGSAQSFEEAALLATLGRFQGGTDA